MSIRIQKRAIDVTPYFHALVCTFADEHPDKIHEIEIVSRRWCADGKRISFLLDTHNGAVYDENEWMDVVECDVPHKDAPWFIESMKRDAADMAKRPHSPVGSTCTGRGEASCQPTNT